jgi:hypothetical protein
MKKLFWIVVLGIAVAFAAAGCKKDKDVSEEKAAPVYPACETDDNCKDHAQVCADGQCRQCKAKAQCKACETCKDFKCLAKENCCSGEIKCPEGLKCLTKPGRTEGTCGTL